MERIEVLPNELKEQILECTLLAELSQVQQMQHRSVSPKPAHPHQSLPIVWSKPTLTRLISFLRYVLDGIDPTVPTEESAWAHATYYVVRIVDLFDLYKHIPESFFRALGDKNVYGFYKRAPYGILQAAGFLRLELLADECHKAQGGLDRSPVSYRSHFDFCHRNDLPSDLCFEDMPDFLLQTFKVEMDGHDDDSGDWFIEMTDGKVRALFVNEYFPSTWLSSDGGPWVYTEKTATIKSYDEYGRWGVMEWNFEDHHFEMEFSNLAHNAGYASRFSDNTNFDRYLCVYDAEGVTKARQARNDLDYDKEEKRERGRAAMVAAMSKEERVNRSAREGRFWVLA